VTGRLAELPRDSPMLGSPTEVFGAFLPSAAKPGPGSGSLGLGSRASWACSRALAGLPR